MVVNLNIKIFNVNHCKRCRREATLGGGGGGGGVGLTFFEK